MNTQLIHNIWCVGRNYADHAQEMKAEKPQKPFFFLKSGSCLETSSLIRLPKWSNNVHHEIEIAFWIDENLNFSHVTLALDLTARDRQAQAKEKGLPWTLAKSFQGACPLGTWISLQDGLMQNGLLPNFELSLKKNQSIVQKGRSQDMLFSAPILLQEIKEFFPVQAHDVLLTGTPAGVGPLQPHDQLEATLSSEGRTLLTCLWDVE